MKLREWLDQANMSMYELSKRLGRHPNTISRIVRGVGRPSIELAKEIQALTFNAVPADSLFGPIMEKPKCPNCGRVMHSTRSRK